MYDKNYPFSYAALIASRTPLENKQDPSIGPYYINLRDGHFAETDSYATTPQDVDQIFDSLGIQAKNANASTPLRLLIWAHGGLVSSPDSQSEATTHGGFHSDPRTMESLARKILRLADSSSLAVKYPPPNASALAYQGWLSSVP